MKKICKISKETKIYPKGITKKIVQSYFGQGWFEVDLYQDDRGLWYYKKSINNYSVENAFAFVCLNMKTRSALLFQPTEFYTSDDNYIGRRVDSTAGYTLDEIKAEMPHDNQFYKVLVQSEHGNICLSVDNNFLIVNAEKTEDTKDSFLIMGEKNSKTLSKKLKTQRIRVSTGKLFTL